MNMKQGFSRATWLSFVAGRYISGWEHQRRAVLDSLRWPFATPVQPLVRDADKLGKMAMATPEDCLLELGSCPNGLTESEAEVRLRTIGLNEVAHERQATWHRQLFHAFNTPFNWLLVFLALLSFLTDDLKATIVLSVMVGLSSVLRFVQEFRSTKAAEKLQAMVSTTATVRRIDDLKERAKKYADAVGIAFNGRSIEYREIPLKFLVPGDVVRLSAGDMVPADVRLLFAKDLFISQAPLTGEAFPVEKSPEMVTREIKNALEHPSICFMGSNVISGSATAVVVNTGGLTYFGGLSEDIVGHREPTEFDKGIHRVSWLLIRFMLVMAPVVLLVNGFAKHDWMEAFLFAIAIAVGLTPEMLPMIVTATLAKGAVKMSQRKVIVKRLNSIQNFGAMDVLCTDKTGTLTQDKIILERHVDVKGEESEEVLRHAFLNSYYQTGLKNLLDVAVLKHAEVAQALQVPIHYRLVDEIPFDFVRRRMSVVVNERDDHNELICKGAVEEIFAACTRAKVDGQSVPLDAALQEQVRMLAQAYNEDGLRVIAVAYKETTPTQKTYSVKDESDLTLLGFIAFLDPPKESAGPAIRAMRDHGVQIKILTGDNDIVTRKVCRDVGIDAEHILLGSDVDALNDESLAPIAEKTAVFAKLSPAQKERIVRILQKNGHVVGFLGDGINDSPALRTADIGISVDTAVDIAKESADIILLEKNLLVLRRGVLEGRKTFGNIVKYIRMAASSNFGNMFSVLGASIFLPFLPMLPIQILVQNLLYDISQTAIPFDNVDKDYMERPRKWEIGSLARFMIFIGPISSIFDYATFGVMWFVFSANAVETQSIFQSGWFIEGLLSQTLIVHIIRTNKIPFIQSRAALPLLLLTASIIAIGIYIPFSPMAHAIGLRPLPLKYFWWLAGILMGYAVLTQLAKSWFVRRYEYR
jgi:Mg2+-importing ATPase